MVSDSKNVGRWLRHYLTERIKEKEAEVPREETAVVLALLNQALGIARGIEIIEQRKK